MNNTTIPLRISFESTDVTKALDFEILLDNNRIYHSTHVSGPVDFEYNINDDTETEHVLEFVMTSKTSDFTKVDEQGNIVSDAMLSVTKISMDDVDIFQLFIERSVYTHSFNGTQSEFDDQFFGHMGCNGRIKFTFATPFYLWLLENM